MTKFWQEHKKALIFPIISFVVVASLMIANHITSFILPASSQSGSVSVQAYDFYMISLSKSKVEKESLARASDFQSLGGGGYIWHEGDYYHVISSAFLNKSDASLVQNNIKLSLGLDSEIISVHFDAFTLNGNFEGEERKVLSSLLSACINQYNTLFDISVRLDTGLSNEMSAKLAVNDNYQSIATLQANFDTLFEEPIPDGLKELKGLLVNAVKISSTLSVGTKENEEQTYSSLIKYRYIELLNLYYNFLG